IFTFVLRLQRRRTTRISTRNRSTRTPPRGWTKSGEAHFSLRGGKNMKRQIWISMLAGLLFSAVTCTVWAQSTAQINGKVTDPSGAVLPGVEVTATQPDTGLERRVVSNETGSFTLTNLPAGAYRLEASLPGFRTYAQTGIVLQVGANPVINIVLEVGALTETVEVQAD